MTRSRGFSFGFLIFLMIVGCGCGGTEPEKPKPVDQLLWVLGLVDSGRGCSFIDLYLDTETIECTEVSVGGTSRPILKKKSGFMLPRGSFRSWYSIGNGDFLMEEDDKGPFFIEKRSGIAFRMEGWRLTDFWQSPPSTPVPRKNSIRGFSEDKSNE